MPDLEENSDVEHKLKPADRVRLINFVVELQGITPDEGSDYPVLDRLTVTRLQAGTSEVLVTCEPDGLRLSAEVLVDSWFADVGEASKWIVMGYVDQGGGTTKGERKWHKPSRTVYVQAVKRKGTGDGSGGSMLNRATGQVIIEQSKLVHQIAERSSSQSVAQVESRVQEIREDFEARADMMNAHSDSNLELNLANSLLTYERDHLKALLEQDRGGFFETPAGERFAMELVGGAIPMIPQLFTVGIGLLGRLGSSPATTSPSPALAERVGRIESLILEQTKALSLLVPAVPPDPAVPAVPVDEPDTPPTQ